MQSILDQFLVQWPFGFWIDSLHSYVLYEDVNLWTKRQSKTEEEWKEQYGNSFELVDTPTYLGKYTSGIVTNTSRKKGLEKKRHTKGRGKKDKKE